MEGRNEHTRWPILLLCLVALGGTALFGPTLAIADDAQWVWADGVEKDRVPAGGACYFRKIFNIQNPQAGEIDIAADDTYELFINGRKIGNGRSANRLDHYDISKQMVAGRNVIAIQAVNTRGNTAAMVARVQVRAEGGDWVSLHSDATWRTTTTNSPMWQTVLFNDRSWKKATSYGRLGDTVPWDRGEDVAETQNHQHSQRFQVQSGFRVQRVLDDEQVGSLIAMTFNEFGHIIASREGEGLLLIFDRNNDGIPEEVRKYGDQVKNVQGILPLNGEVFVTGDGPEGLGVYRLSDVDRNGTLEKVRAIAKFEGSNQEHGPHGIALGPDGMLYVVVGNHAKLTEPFDATSPLQTTYEGDLVTPRYEDPGGHAQGIQAPGGFIVRVDIDGKRKEIVAGGLRNAYDLAFHPNGTLLTHDSDMEADAGTAWYRSTNIFAVVPGGEYGWRSGWSAWPEYYVDRLPPILDTGRGSPTGAVVYEHFGFPAKYHGTFFTADWSEGRILAVRLKGEGAGYSADKEVFISGQPLNVTDLSVAPDGSLYFCTGGRGTAGGIYRVVWDGTIPDRVKELGTGIAAAIRQPQIESAWGRQQVAALKQRLGNQWAELVAGVAYSDDNPPHYRLRALDLMQLFGPAPSPELLQELSRAESETVRTKAAYLLGLQSSSTARERLIELLADEDRNVQRVACESLARESKPVPIDAIIPLLGSRDRSLSFAARRLIETQPVEKWESEVLQSDNPRTSILGGVALMTIAPDQDTAHRVIEKTTQMMSGFLSDTDFLDVLRLQQLAIHRAKLPADELETLRDQLAEEFPSGESRLNRELIRLCAYLQANQIVPRGLQYVAGDAPMEDRMLVGMYLRFLSYEWTASERFELIKFYELAARAEGGSSYPLYLMHVTRDFAKNLSEEDARLIVSEGNRWPNAALASLYRLPRQIDEGLAEDLRKLDDSIRGPEFVDDVYKRLRTGITALLSMAGDESSMAYLRKVWREDPERRQSVAMGLALRPEDENWDYLVRSLNILEGAAAEDVLGQLATVDVSTDDPEATRQVILLGLRAQAQGQPAQAATALLAHWNGEEGAKEPDSIASWQSWYAGMYPDRPAATLPEGDDAGRWDLEQINEYLDSDAGRGGDPQRGRELYTKAQCASCHRFGNEGTPVGPDLSSIARRFTRREVLESVLYPSHVISDQYRSKKVLTHDGNIHTGIVTQLAGGGVEIRDSKNDVISLQASDIDQVLPSNVSVMPSGLLDPIALSEIGDLLSYLGVLPPLEVAGRDASSASTKQDPIQR
jgi:putative heme-binding domain-containing protein